jgi:hypothetical protein
LAIPEYLYKAVEYRYNEGQWRVERIIEIPTLKALVSN